MSDDFFEHRPRMCLGLRFGSLQSAGRCPVPLDGGTPNGHPEMRNQVATHGGLRTADALIQ